MAGSIFSIIVFLVFLAGFILNPRKKRENGIHLFVLGQVFLLITAGAGAALLHMLGIAVNLVTVSIVTAIVDAALMGRIIFLRKLGELEWKLSDCIALIILAVTVLCISIHRFGPELALTYGDVDAARYFQHATIILNTETVHSQYLSTLIHVIFISILKPVLPVISYYKGMIAAQIYMQILSIWMFHILTGRINRRRCFSWVNFVITALYFGGYQLYTLVYGTFLHSADGILFLMLLIYYTVRLQKDEISYLRGIGSLLLGLFGLLICYPYYMIIAVPVFLPEVGVWLYKNIHKLDNRQKIALAAGLVIVIMGGLVFAGQRIGNSFTVFLEQIKGDGLAFKEPYMDFFFFLPVLIVYIGTMLKHRKENKVIMRMNIAAIIFLVIWFGIYLAGYLSSYYYYRMYYVMWLLAWLLAGHTASVLWRNKQRLCVAAYGVFYGAAILISISNLNERLWEIKPEMFLEEKSDFLPCPMYAFNYEAAMAERMTRISDAEFDLYGYVIENLGQAEVSMISSFYTTMQSEWYAGITGKEKLNANYQLDSYSLKSIFELIDYYGAEYILIEKDDAICMSYYDSVFSRLLLEVEKPAGYIFKRSEDTWVKTLLTMEGSTPELIELGEFVRTTYPINSVPVICESSLSYNLLEYGAFAGEESRQYVGVISPEEFISLTYRFNIDEVEYMTVLKNSEMYRMNREYFDKQEKIFENEAGMVITHAGTGWMPSEQ